MDAETEGDLGQSAAERETAAAHASQASLTESVGKRLTRSDHDDALPGWRRWLTKLRPSGHDSD